MAGDWPWADRRSRTSLSAELADVPTDAVVVVDGLVASAAPEVLVPEANRLRLVVLVHLPLGVEPPPGGRPSAAAGDERSRECAALARGGGRGRDEPVEPRLAPGHLPRWRPTGCPSCRRGSTLPQVVAGSAAGGRVVCVGAVTPTKGQDLLVEALAAVADLGWAGTCVGSTDLDPAFAAARPPPGGGRRRR